jgi:hypothetical protein
MLPEQVAVKFSAYSLYCRQMLDQLPALKRAVFGESEIGDGAEVSWDDCITTFDEPLSPFLLGRDFDNTVEAAGQLGNLLRARAGSLTAKNLEIPKIFERVIANSLAQASTWNFEEDIKRYHDQGRELARKFFKDSHCEQTKQKLDRYANLIVEYGSSGSSGDSRMGNPTWGYRLAPAATVHEVNEAGVSEPTIVVRVSYDHDFNLYMLYPFLFLHEYTAHIFANDFRNATFNDGWMLFAASEFLISEWQNSAGPHPLCDDQAYVFREAFSSRLKRNPRRGYDLAYRLTSWLENDSPGLTLQAITHELSAFVPKADEKNSLPSQLINALERQFLDNREALQAKLSNAKDIRMLLASLTAT